MEALGAGDPARIGPFRLVARLGRGGMGRVYLGRAESTGRAVAVKTIHGELLADPEFRARFTQEVAAARRVRDEYIAEVVDADAGAALPWLATVYVPGISVEDAVRRFGPLPPASVRVLGVCVARAVAAIHAVGLVHRDLKPSNVLLTANGPKVIDFGIARGVADPGLTQTGMVSGSPPYMAPEQLLHGEFGPSSDIFSLASILHYAATAAGPYGRGGAQEQYARALAAGPLLDDSLPPELVGHLAGCLTADPAIRPNAAQLVRALEAWPNERTDNGWLPSAVLQAILTQAADALNTESAVLAAPRPPAPPAERVQPRFQPPLQPPPLRPQTPNTPPRPAPQRPPVQPPAPRVQTPPAPYRPPYQIPLAHPGPYAYNRPPGSNGMAVASLVLALVGIIVPCVLVLALVFGLVGLAKARTAGSGRGQAMAGTIISAVLILGWALLISWAAKSATFCSDTGGCASSSASARLTATAPPARVHALATPVRSGPVRR